MDALLPRHIAPVAVEMLQNFPAILIEGARQVGKSTLAGQIAASDAVVTTLDRAQTRDAAVADPAGFIAQAEDRQLVIDEIQRLPELTLAVKAAIDADRRPGRFILTGSASLLRVRGLADSLAGRVARLGMFGLSRGEATGTADDFVTVVAEGAAGLPDVTSTLSRSDYAELLATGAYPDVRDVSPRVRATWIDSYLQGLVGRDMSELRREVRPARVMAMLRALAGRQSAELVKAKLVQQSAIPASTITGYLDLLHDVGLIADIPPWTPNLAKREVGRPKTFIIDSALAMRLARLTAAQVSTLDYGEALGSMLEAFVAADLLRQRTWSQRAFDVFHYRDRDGDEVDLVLELDDGSVIAIEVKAAQSFGAGQFRNLVRLRDRLGERFIAGVVLNTGDRGFRYADRLYGAPVSALWTASL